MNDQSASSAAPRALVLSDIPENADRIVETVLEPGGIPAWTQDAQPDRSPDIIILDIAQLRGDPLSALRTLRSDGLEMPAIVLAAHFPATYLRDLFRLGVADILTKPYKPVDLCRTVLQLGETRTGEINTAMLTRKLNHSREEARRRSEELRWISEIGRVVVQLENLDEILGRVVEAAAFLAGAEESNLYLADPDSEDVILRASKQIGEEQATLPRLRTSDTMAGSVYSTGEPIIRHPEFTEGIKVQTGFLVQSLIMVPIRIPSKIVGVLAVYNRTSQRPFSDHHMTLLAALADWAGMAIGRTSGAFLPPEESSQDLGETALEVEPGVLENLDAAVREADTLASLLQGVPPSSKALSSIARLQEQLNQLAGARYKLIADVQRDHHVDVQQLLDAILEDIRPEFEKRNIELIVEAKGVVPLIDIDQGRLRQVLSGLIGAAMRRTELGKVTIGLFRLRITPDTPLPSDVDLAPGSWVVLRVSDTSSGLSPDTIRALENAELDPNLGDLGPGLKMGEIRMIVQSLGATIWHERATRSNSIVIALPLD